LAPRPSSARSTIARTEPSTVPPVIFGDLVVVCRTDGLLVAFERTSGAERWRLRLAWDDPNGSWLTEHLLIDAGLSAAYDTATGREVWRKNGEPIP